MGMIPKATHDLFISYSHKDNRQVLLDSECSRWVSTLAITLEQRLSDRMHPELVDIWRDTTNLEGNSALDESLLERARCSDLFLLVLSPYYLASDFCAVELRAFSHSAEKRELDATARIFVVHRTPTRRETRPGVIRDLIGYEFFRENPDTKKIEVFGDPLPSKKLPTEYHEAVQNLVESIAKQLERIRKQARPKKKEGSADTFFPVEKAVYLAPGTPDLAKWHKRLRNHFESAGYRVLPDEREQLSHAPAEYDAKVQESLDVASLFLQILGPVHERPFPPAFPQGFERWQFERAKEAGVPILQWRSRGLKVDEIADDDPEHRKFVFAPKVVSCDFEDFKAFALDLANGSPRIRPSGNRRILLINLIAGHEPPAQPAIQTVRDLCAEFEIDMELMNVDHDDLRQLDDNTAQDRGFHGMVIICDQSSRQACAVRRLVLVNDRLKSICCLYDEEPQAEPPLQCERHVVRIASANRPRLREFLAHLAGRKL